MERALTCAIFLVLTMHCALGGSLVGQLLRSHQEELALFPEKRSWCSGQPIEQVVSHPGCAAKRVANLACFGQCLSYSAPESLPPETSNQGDLHHCESCQSAQAHWQKVELHCSYSVTGSDRVGKLVQVITECGCQPCSGTKLPEEFEPTAESIHSQNYRELITGLEAD